MTEPRTCAHCGTAEGELTEFNGRLYCPDCGSRFLRTHNRSENDDFPICPECYDRDYTRCVRCGRIIDTDHCWYPLDNDDPYCADCCSTIENSPIHDYYFKPYPIFYGEGPRYFGVELEIDDGGECDSSAEALMDIVNQSRTLTYCKHDGSLDDGFEIVTHPMSLDCQLHEMPWAEVLDKAIGMGYLFHQAGTCGLHIHVSRKAFGDTLDAQDNAIARVLFFVERHWAELLRFSRRTQRQLEQWAARYGYRDRPGEMLDDADLFAKFSKENRTAAQKLLDSLKEFIAKVKSIFTGKVRDVAAQAAYGKDFAELEDIAKQWQAAFDAAAQQAEKAKTAAGEGDGVKYSLKNTSDKTVVSIKQQIASASKTLNDTEPVVQKNVSEIFSEINIKQKRAWAETEALKYGNHVDRQGYGKIEVSRKDVNSALNYLQSDGEIAAVATLPYVLKRGKEIYREADHKGRGYSTVTFAAPVVINGVRGNMAVVVRETSKNHYDMHRIVMPDGSAFTFAKKTNAETGPTAATSSTDALTQPTASTSKNSIPTEGENVKPQFSLKAYSEAEKKGHVKSAKEFFGETNNWNETGYITTDGTKLDFSGRHEGAPGGQTGRRGDGGVVQDNARGDFNPRPPRGGRQALFSTVHPNKVFQSTPPRGGATILVDGLRRCINISIHAPREGGRRTCTT